MLVITSPVILSPSGMSEEDADKLEQEEAAQEEEEEMKRRRNILLDLDHRYDLVRIADIT